MNHQKLFIKQLIDYSEIILPAEARNRYSIMDEKDQQIYYAYEMPGKSRWAWLIRSLLVELRPFKLMVIDNDQQSLLTAVKPFNIYFHKIDVFNKGEKIGYVKRKFSIANKAFDVYTGCGKFICELTGPIWKPWTFNIVRDDKVYGMVKKSWSGSITEAFTDADMFGISFPDGAELHEKKVLLAAVFLIDFVYFEGKAGFSLSPGI